MEFFVTLVSGWKLLINVKKSFILDITEMLDTLLLCSYNVTKVTEKRLVKKLLYSETSQ